MGTDMMEEDKEAREMTEYPDIKINLLDDSTPECSGEKEDDLQALKKKSADIICANAKL